MKKLASTSRQRKKQATTTNVVHVKQVESRSDNGGLVRRTVQNRTRSCESAVQSSDSVQEEEETMATSNLSTEMLKSRESTTDTGAPKRSSREPSESSLTLSLPKEIRTSWLEHDRSSKSETDAAAAAPAASTASAALVKPPPLNTVQTQRTHTQETRSTAKSIFSTNKSVILETQRNSISALPAGHAPLPCRPPDYPPEVSTETSEYSDVHQYQSLDESFNSHSDKEFRSLSSKAAAPLGSDVSLVGLPAAAVGTRAGSESSIGTKPFVVSSRADVDSAESRDAVVGPHRAGEEAFRNGWFSQAQQQLLQPNVSASLDTTALQAGAADLPSATSLESHKFWSADVLPAISSCTSAATGLESDESGAAAREDGQNRLKGVTSADSGALYGHDGRPLLKSSSFKSAVSTAVSDHDAAASLQNIPGKMADLFKAFATPALESYEATSASSTTFPLSKEQVSTATVKGAHQERALGVSTSAVLGSTGATAAASSLTVGQPTRRFSLRESSDAASKDTSAMDKMSNAFAPHEQQLAATGFTGSGVIAPGPPKQHAASHTQVGSLPYGLPAAKRLKKGTESGTTTASFKSKSQTEPLPGMTAVAGSARAVPFSIEQPHKSFTGVPVSKTTIGEQRRELATESRGRGGASSLTAEHGKRGKHETGSLTTTSGRSSPKVGPREHRKHPSAGKVPSGAGTPRGEARKKHSSHSPTTSGAATPKLSAEGRGEHAPSRRTASGTTSPKVAAGIQQQVPGILDWKGGAMPAQPSLAPIDERFERSTTSFSISEAAAPKAPPHIAPAAVDRDGRTEQAIPTTAAPKAEGAAAAPAVAELTQATLSAKVQADRLATATTVPGVDQTSTRPDSIGIELAKVEGSADLEAANLASFQERSRTLVADANMGAEVPSTLDQQVAEKTLDGESTELGSGIVAEHQITQSITHSFTVIPLTKRGPDIEKETGVSVTVTSDAVITQHIGEIGPESSEIDVATLPEERRRKPSESAGESKDATFADAAKEVPGQPYEATPQEDQSATADFERKQTELLADHKKTLQKEQEECRQALEQAEKLPSLEHSEAPYSEGGARDYESMNKQAGKPLLLEQPDESLQRVDQQEAQDKGLKGVSEDPEQAEKLRALEHVDLQNKESGTQDNEVVLKQAEKQLQLEELEISKQPDVQQAIQREESEILQDIEQTEKSQQLEQSVPPKKEGDELEISKQPEMQQAMQREELGEILQDLEQTEKLQQLGQSVPPKKEGGEQDREDVQKFGVPGEERDLLDKMQIAKPKLPTGELAEALLAAPIDASTEDSRMSLEQTIDSTRRGVIDDQAERPADQLAPFPDKSANALREPSGEERVRPSASTPVSKEGREPCFLFEESLRRPTTSSSWADTSIQEEERRRSSSVGSPRAALTVSTAPSDDGHLSTDHGDKVLAEQRRRTSTPSSVRPGAVTSSARTDDAALPASGAPEYAEPMSKDQQRGPDDRSDSLTVDGSITATCKGPGLDFHGDVSRKSQEAIIESGVTQEDRSRALTGVFSGPGSEDAATEHAVTVSDSRGFQPSLGEGLAQHPRQGPTGAQEGTEAGAAAGKKDEKRSELSKAVATKPFEKLDDIELTASAGSDDIDEEAERTRDLYPFLAPEEDLRMAVSAMHLPYEPQETMLDFEQSFGGKSTFRDDQSSTTFLPVSSEEVRKGRGVGQRGSAATSDSLREESIREDQKDRESVALSDSDLGRSPPAEIIFARSPPHVLGLPCTALVEIPREQPVSLAPSREVLAQNFWESEGGLSPGNYGSISLETSEAPSRSDVLQQAAARIFRVASPLRGIFPAQEPITLNVPLLPQAPPQEVAVEKKESDETVKKPKKIKEMSERMVSTVRSTLDSAAPVIALSFALFAFVTAAALLLSRQSDEVHHL